MRATPSTSTTGCSLTRIPFGPEERNYSEHTSEVIDAEVRRISDELFQRASTLLTRHRADLNAVAAQLIAKETLSRPELDEMLGNRKGTPRRSGLRLAAGPVEVGSPSIDV
jgi:ATP-dependent Zn protease